MLAKAMNCLSPRVTDGLPDFCSECSNCVRIGLADDLSALCAEAVETRDNLRETDKKETRLLIQTHPDVLIIPPDPADDDQGGPGAARDRQHLLPAGGSQRKGLRFHRFGIHERGR